MVATKALPAADCSSRRSVAVSFAAMRVQVVMAMLKTVVGKTKELRCNLDKEEEEEVFLEMRGLLFSHCEQIP